ncbi:hypothetical protein NL676_031773 [Syzygium grande]|nr:hypothetical protein NL676_031773 [Syzygium grande]
MEAIDSNKDDFISHAEFTTFGESASPPRCWSAFSLLGNMRPIPDRILDIQQIQISSGDSARNCWSPSLPPPLFAGTKLPLDLKLA